MQLLGFKKHLINYRGNNALSAWLNELNDEDFIYYSFITPVGNHFHVLNPEDYSFNYFRAKFVRCQLISFFKEKEFLVEPYPKGNDLSVYEKLQDYNKEWSIYRRYDFLVNAYRKEIGFNIGSENTLISNSSQTFSDGDKIRIIDSYDEFIKPLGNRTGINNSRIIANSLIRKTLNFPHEVRKLNYKNLYNQLISFYNNYLLNLVKDGFKIEAGGFKNVDQPDLNRVSINENLMLFGKDKTDISAITGIRDYGIYKPSPKASDVKFIFLYENSPDANQLFLNLKNGLKHYPGLWSYVGIPIRLSELKLKYTGVDDLKIKIEQFIATNLPNDYYDDLLAVVINPNSSQEKEEVEENEDPMYYDVKRRFLEKGIPTQFIQDKNIHSGNFHYFLPNISIGILAKLGGIPWRLKTKKSDELVIGFNQKKLGDNRYIGSAVFFSNDGELGRTFGFPETNSDSVLIRNLKSAIEQYIHKKQVPPERLVIHYYKPQSGREQKSIEDLIQNELRLNIPFAIVEINDSKSQMDICFDKDFFMGMPESGTYVRLSKSEYLLFNNTRYQKNPLRSVPEELPIKIAIHFADTGGFSHKELIRQVYEFSRLYWKGLKQKSQPATTIYAKLVADFTANYGGILPDNETVHNTPWFL
jgi:hypothetical protein